MPQPKQHGSAAQKQAAYRNRLRQREQAVQSAKGLTPLPAIGAIPGTRRWKQVLEVAEQAVRDVQGQMQTYYEDRSEQWQEADKGDTFIERMNAVEQLVDQIAECRSQFD
jgi:hypothetical protein